MTLGVFATNQNIIRLTYVGYSPRRLVSSRVYLACSQWVRPTARSAPRIHTDLCISYLSIVSRIMSQSN